MLWRAPCGHFRDSVPAGEMVCVCMFKRKADVQLEPLKTLPPLTPASRSSLLGTGAHSPPCSAELGASRYHDILHPAAMTTASLETRH